MLAWGNWQNFMQENFGLIFRSLSHSQMTHNIEKLHENICLDVGFVEGASQRVFVTLQA